MNGSPPSSAAGGLGGLVADPEHREQRERRQRIDVIRLLCDLTDLCGGDGTLADIAAAVVERVCRFNGFHVGRAYFRGEGEEDRIELVAEHLGVEARVLHACHQSLPCRAVDGGDAAVRAVLAGAQPVWGIAPIDGENGRGCDRAEYCVVLPITVDQAVVGALQFFSPARPTLPEGVREAIESMGVQLGRVAERQRTDAAVQRAITAERTRVIRTLHETIGQSLGDLAAAATRLERRLGAKEAVDAAAIRGLSEDIRHSFDDMRTELAELVAEDVRPVRAADERDGPDAGEREPADSKRAEASGSHDLAEHLALPGGRRVRVATGHAIDSSASAGTQRSEPAAARDCSQARMPPSRFAT